MRTHSLVSLALAFAAPLALLSPLTAARAIEPVRLDARQDDAEGHWVAAWTAMPQLVEPNNMPPAQFASGSVLRDATLRQTLHMSTAAPKIKLAISNTFGGSDLPISAASIGLPTGGSAGVSGIQASPLAAITVGGQASFTVKRGEVVVSDEIDFPVEAEMNVAVSLYSQQGQSGRSITGHPGSRTTSWFASGNKVNSTSMGGQQSVHWYFVSAIHAYVPPTTSALIVLGDSITDGRGSETDQNNRWPDLVLARLQDEGYTNVTVNNQAAGGNCVLSQCLGPPLINRYERDALSQPGVKWVMIFEGVNDIGNGPTTTQQQQQLGDRLIQAFTTIVQDAKAAGLVTIGGTIMPFGGQGQGYSHPTREATRVRINEWIMTSGTFDHVVDLATLVADPNDQTRLNPMYDGGDHLHPNVAGYQAVADGFPIEIFNE